MRKEGLRLCGSTYHGSVAPAVYVSKPKRGVSSLLRALSSASIAPCTVYEYEEELLLFAGANVSSEVFSPYCTHEPTTSRLSSTAIHL